MATMVLEMTGDEVRMIRSIQRVIDQQRKMDEAGRRVAKRGEEVERAQAKAGQAGEKAFGRNAQQNLVNFAKGVLSVSAAWASARKALESYRQTQDKARDTLKGSIGGLARLSQFAPEKAVQLRREARASFARGVGANLGEAGDFVFALESAGALSEAEFFELLESSGVIPNAAAIAKSAQTIRTSLGKRAGSFENIVSRAFVASEFNPEQVPALLEAASRAGGSAKALNIRLSDVLGATAISAAAEGTAAGGGTRVASFLKSMELFSTRLEKETDRRVKLDTSRGVIGLVEQVQAQGLTGEQLFKVLGRQEAVAGFRDLRDNIEKLTSGIGEISGVGATEARRRALSALDDPAIRLDRLRRQTEAREFLARERQATFGLGREAVLNQAREQAARRGFFAETAVGAANFLNRLLVSDATFARRLMREDPQGFFTRGERGVIFTGEQARGSITPDIRVEIEQIFDNLLESSDQLRDSSQNLNSAAVNISSATDPNEAARVKAVPERE